MGCTGGPGINTDNLVLCVDKDDGVSYVGEPTTNLCNPDMSAWSVDASGYGSSGVRTLHNEDDGLRAGTSYSNEIAHIVDTDDNTRQHQYITGLSGNTAYNLSIYFRKITGTPTFRYQLTYYNGGSYISAAWVQTSTLGISDTSGWQRVAANITTPSNCNKILWWLQDGADYTGYTHIFELKRPQFEQKTNASNFINGSRSATGGWKDLSGAGNDVNLTSITYTVGGGISSNDFQFIQSSSNMAKRSALAQPSTSGNVSGSMSACFWIYPRNGNGGILNSISGSSKDGIYFGFYDQYNPTVYAADSNGGDWSVSRSSSAVTANTWSSVCAVMNGTAGTCTVFINGTQIASSATSGGAGGWMWGSNDLQIGGNFGNWNSNTEFDGWIASAHIYHDALTATEIKSNFDAQRGRFGI